MTKEQLKYNIRVKLDTNPGDDTEDYYADYYDSLIDECLSVVANATIPYQKTITIKWGGYIDDLSKLNDSNKDFYFTAGVQLDLGNGEIANRKDWVEYRDGGWHVQHKNSYGYLATIPDDFLSFSDEGSIEYRSLDDELFLNVDVLYINSKTIALSKDGSYTIHYNAEYPTVKEQDELNFIPSNVFKIIPTYVAGQILTVEDPIKAAQLKNEFETMLARLDNNKPLISYNINNESGWTL